jgi:hypothetical protein
VNATTSSVTMGTGFIQQIVDVGVITRVVTAASSTTRAAQHSIKKVVAGAAAAKVMVSSIPLKQRSIQKVADTDLLSTS